MSLERSNKGLANLLVFGSAFFFVILVILTYDTLSKLPERTAQITAEVDAGKKAWHKYDCIGCHTILGNGSYFAPDMTKIAERKPKGYLREFLIEPKSVNLKATMPRLGITMEEAESLLAFLEWTSKIDTNRWPPKPILARAGVTELVAGQRIYQQLNCSACHMIGGIGGTGAPDLSRVGAKRNREWLVSFLKDPRAINPKSPMPGLGHLSDKELNDLVDFLLTLK